MPARNRRLPRAPQTWTLSRHSRSRRPEGGGTAHRDDHRPYP
ncbi:hypothetical protein ACFWJ4_26390 [Kitasatospora sp. NPDC127067]